MHRPKQPHQKEDPEPQHISSSPGGPGTGSTESRRAAAVTAHERGRLAARREPWLCHLQPGTLVPTQGHLNAGTLGRCTPPGPLKARDGSVSGPSTSAVTTLKVALSLQEMQAKQQTLRFYVPTLCCPHWGMEMMPRRARGRSGSRRCCNPSAKTAAATCSGALGSQLRCEQEEDAAQLLASMRLLAMNHRTPNSKRLKREGNYLARLPASPAGWPALSTLVPPPQSPGWPSPSARWLQHFHLPTQPTVPERRGNDGPCTPESGRPLVYRLPCARAQIPNSFSSGSTVWPAALEPPDLEAEGRIQGGKERRGQKQGGGRSTQ